jgi:hypothetical protein
MVVVSDTLLCLVYSRDNLDFCAFIQPNQLLFNYQSNVFVGSLPKTQGC